jgi:hypothetical protein
LWGYHPLAGRVALMRADDEEAGEAGIEEWR